MYFRRVPCPVVSCSHDMPANQPMCATCWQHVPADMRKQIYLKAPSSRSHQDLISQAVRIAVQAKADAAAKVAKVLP